MLLACCGSSQRLELPPALETLLPNIADDGTKFFIFQRLNLDPEQDPTDVLLRGRSIRTESFEARANDIRAFDEAVAARLAEVLTATAYCREGYFELDREQNRELIRVRGECREDANTADRQRFRAEAIEINAVLP